MANPTFIGPIRNLKGKYTFLVLSSGVLAPFAFDREAPAKELWKTLLASPSAHRVQSTSLLKAIYSVYKPRSQRKN